MGHAFPGEDASPPPVFESEPGLLCLAWGETSALTVPRHLCLEAESKLPFLSCSLSCLSCQGLCLAWSCWPTCPSIPQCAAEGLDARCPRAMPSSPPRTESALLSLMGVVNIRSSPSQGLPTMSSSSTSPHTDSFGQYLVRRCFAPNNIDRRTHELKVYQPWPKCRRHLLFNALSLTDGRPSQTHSCLRILQNLSV